jgi:hypothetical protein
LPIAERVVTHPLDPILGYDDRAICPELPGEHFWLRQHGNRLDRRRTTSVTSENVGPRTRAVALARGDARRHALEAVIEAICAEFDRSGELAAAIELRRRFPGLSDNAGARECARMIARWRPATDDETSPEPSRDPG